MLYTHASVRENCRILRLITHDVIHTAYGNIRHRVCVPLRGTNHFTTVFPPCQAITTNICGGTTDNL